MIIIHHRQCNQVYGVGVEWMDYLITKILAPRGYTLNGEIEWYGDAREDMGRIVVTNNKVKTQIPRITWCDKDDAKANDYAIARKYFTAHVYASSNYDPNTLTFDIPAAEYKELIEKNGKDTCKQVCQELGIAISGAVDFYDGHVTRLRFFHTGNKTMFELWNELKVRDRVL